MDGATSRHILFVVGMHRTGTSALCAALNAAGAHFGPGLLEPMAGVNDEGFWEAGEVVAINEGLLAEAGYQWYTVTPAAVDIDWSAPRFDSLHERARAYLASLAISPGDVHVIKDPRLCITLPFWLPLAAQAVGDAAVCLIQRPPIEIARSLQQRDAFPAAFGLRLTATYLEAALRHAPAHAVRMTYAELLNDPAAAIAPLAERLGLSAGTGAVRDAVRGELCHQSGAESAMDTFDGEGTDPGLAGYLEQLRPAESVDDDLAAFAVALVEKSRTLTELGEAHRVALETLDERDEQIADFEREHSRALATIDERDAQLVDCNARIDELQVRDARLQRLESNPLAGPLLKMLWRHADG